MTKESLATLLNGREYGSEVTREEHEAAKAAGLIIVYGASDDNMEFEGAVSDEFGAYRGATVVIYPKRGGWEGVHSESEYIRDVMPDEALEAALRARRVGNTVTSVWAPKHLETSWLMQTDLPHATFDIFEDGELYCRGLVLDVKDLK